MKIELNISFTLRKLMNALKYTSKDFASFLNLDIKTINNYLTLHTNPTQKVFNKIVKLIEDNNLDVYQLLDVEGDEGYLFHGSKTSGIYGKISTLKNFGEINDFSNGFYLSDSLRNAVTYVIDRKEPVIYRFKKEDVYKGKEYSFKKERNGEIDWVIFIGLNRKKIVNQVDNMFFSQYYDEKFKKYSLLVGEIADSYNFDILNDFFNGTKDIEETKQALILAHIGLQYVLKDEIIASNLTWQDEYTIEKNLKEYLIKLIKQKKKILNERRNELSSSHVFDKSNTFEEIKRRMIKENE